MGNGGWCPALAVALLMALPGAAEPLTRTSGGQLIVAPASAADQPAWLEGLKRWRDSVKLDGSRYDDPRLGWTRRNVVQSLVIAQERTLYDPVARKYTVDRYLDDVRRRFGGVDSVILWHTYPNIGIDDRNQHDHLRDMPGGLPGLKKLVADFHKRGVRVLIPIMPWDRGTRDEGGPLHEAMARDAAAIGADGLFGDTLSGIGREFAEAAPGLALEPELNLGDDAMLAWNTTSWGQFWDESVAPGISAYRWLEPRHVVHVTARWSTDRTADLQRAFLNGAGYCAWENIWGLWNGLTPKDAESLRRIAAIERHFADLLATGEWEPYVPTGSEGVFASRFSDGKQTLWLLVNRGKTAATASLTAPVGVWIYDLWRGQELRSPSVAMPGHGFGAVLAVDGKAPAGLSRLLKEMAALPEREAEPWKVLPQRMVPIAPTKPAASAPDGMVLVRGGRYTFRVSGVEIEGDDAHGVDVQYPWEDAPRREHERTMDIAPFYIDRTPVTNAQFAEFLKATKYRPKDGHNFLRHWKDGACPEGWGNKPVTWVSLEDARAYAAWAGKRLPHEWEWQYAAQGVDGRAYPWGSEWDAARVSPTDTGRTMGPPADVDAFPAGAGPFGALDMVGNVWQWTDEFEDDHTRAAVLKGGSFYRPQGSDWYFPQAHRVDRHGKYLLMSPGKDRSGAIGFRCVKDGQDSGVGDSDSAGGAS